MWSWKCGVHGALSPPQLTSFSHASGLQLYTFAVSNGLDKWDVSKRYSDFVKLHAKVASYRHRRRNGSVGSAADGEAIMPHGMAPSGLAGFSRWICS